jgi:uncharacterized protein
MLIEKMTEMECREVLARASIGRLGCSRDDQPYVVPICLAYEQDYFYVLSTLGQKIEWMRDNPKVCVEIEEIASRFEWTSVVVNGRYQELPEPQFTAERALGRALLEKRALWWQTALAERQLKSEDSLIPPLFFRIHVESLTGLRAADPGGGSPAGG